MDLKDIEKFSGEGDYRRPRKLVLSEVRLDGTSGEFKRIDKKGDKYVPTSLGNRIEGIFLRVRRRLIDFNKKLTTSEHNTAKDNIVLFTDKGIEKGIASEIREKYESLRTHQIVYMLLRVSVPNQIDTGKLGNYELVKLTVRGASLGSMNKPKDSIPFYEYLGKFKDSGDDKEHVWQYTTKLESKAEKGKLGDYFAIHFERGSKISDVTLETVGENMKELHEVFTSQDQYFNVQIAKTSKEGTDMPVVDEIPTINLDDELKADNPF